MNKIRKSSSEEFVIIKFVKTPINKKKIPTYYIVGGLFGLTKRFCN
jgi:hypothetical protein